MAKRYPLCGHADTYREPSDKSIELIGGNRKMVPHAYVADVTRCYYRRDYNVTQRDQLEDERAS